MLSNLPRVAHVPKELIGISGRCYAFKELLQSRPHLGSVWVATYENESFVLKDVPKNLFSNFNDRIWPPLRQDPSPLLRLPIDTISGRATLVYQHLEHDLLYLVKAKISMHARWHILKTALQAIADLHQRDIVHLDIKPDNIVVDCQRLEAATTVKQVKIIDLENAAHLPSGKCIKGMLAGNDAWRSAEAHFKGELSKPTDMFSFGLVCIYAMLDKVICGRDEDFQKHELQGALPAMIRLQRLVSYFGDKEGINGLMKHVGDEEINCQILSMLWDERNEDYIPYKPFAEWPEVRSHQTFRDLIKGLMTLDPRKRLTATQALEHLWFADESHLIS